MREGDPAQEKENQQPEKHPEEGRNADPRPIARPDGNMLVVVRRPVRVRAVTAMMMVVGVTVMMMVENPVRRLQVRMQRPG